MKKFIISITCILCIIIFLNILFPTYKQREYEYYLDKSNYITVSGTIIDIECYDDNRMYIDISDKSVRFTDTGFCIKGDNFSEVKKNNINDILRIGKTVEFVCAPRYFGDGYSIPIVALTVEGDVLLDFEIGYNNLIASYVSN